jgi:RNA polymerase sigma factor (sigma-70 family)
VVGDALPLLDECVGRARDGDQYALEQLLRALQDDIYRLALRMVWHPEDAADATQEILIRITTHLSTFRGESSVRTWAYRVGVNHLLNRRRARVEHEELTFDVFADQLATGLSDMVTDPAGSLVVEEIKLGCTLGMLQCLDRDHRVAYILGEVFHLDSEEAALITETSPAAYRKRLSRARARIRDFVHSHCGLVEPDRACHCRRRVPASIAAGRVDREHLLFASHPTRDVRATAEMQFLHDAAGLMRAHPKYAAPNHLLEEIRRLLGNDADTLLSSDEEP